MIRSPGGIFHDSRTEIVDQEHTQADPEKNRWSIPASSSSSSGLSRFQSRLPMLPRIIGAGWGIHIGCIQISARKEGIKKEIGWSKHEEEWFGGSGPSIEAELEWRGRRSD